MRGIDLYSGVGGWSLGLALAGIDVVASYDRWAPACTTNHTNNAHDVREVNIRELDVASLPRDLDAIVGSPPCTQFSMSNRGGKGDLEDGMRDVRRFLEIVEHCKPRFWVLENVPRVAELLKTQLRPGGTLARFAHLRPDFAQLNSEEFGIPQRRRRCLIGNIDFDLLRSYSLSLPRRTLGNVIDALANPEIVKDPIFGVQIQRHQVTDHEIERALDLEEVRINSALKMRHPIYNAMPFPDPLDRAARTITATCTRVSRESIIIECEKQGGYRRLSIRERASAQGFPITFQFIGSTHSQKMTMVGNAFPPPLAFHIGMAMRGIPKDKIASLESLHTEFALPNVLAPMTTSLRAFRRFPPNRRFRFAIPSLQLKSGVRFEVSNQTDLCGPGWAVRFFFGTPQDVRSLPINRTVADTLIDATSAEHQAIAAILRPLQERIRDMDIASLQDVWSDRGAGRTNPFELLDCLSVAGEQVVDTLRRSSDADEWVTAIRGLLAREFGPNGPTLAGAGKLYRNAELIAAGILVGGWANAILIAPPPEKSSPSCTPLPQQSEALQLSGVG